METEGSRTIEEGGEWDHGGEGAREWEKKDQGDETEGSRTGCCCTGVERGIAAGLGEGGGGGYV